MAARTWVARSFGRVVNVEADEASALAFGYHFLLFTAYYILRSLRDSTGSAAVAAAWMALAIALGRHHERMKPAA